MSLSNGDSIKIAAIFSLLAVALTGGLLPIYWRQVRESPKVLAIANCFAGGVFLSLAMNHLLPDAMADLEETSTYPLAFTLAVACYVFVLGLEKVILGREGEHLHGHSHRPMEVESAPSCAVVASNSAPSTKSQDANSVSSGTPAVAVSPADDFVTAVAVVATIGIEEETNSNGSGGHHHQGHAHHDHHTIKSYGAYFLMFFLSLHSIFEGIALGLQEDTNSVVTLFIGIVLHKWAEGVSLATAFIKGKKDRTRSLGLMIIFSLASPVGIAIGMGVESYDSAAATGVFTALAAGTFLYVACNEIVAHEFEDKVQRPLRFLALLAGVALICVVTALEP